MPSAKRTLLATCLLGLALAAQSGVAGSLVVTGPETAAGHERQGVFLARIFVKRFSFQGDAVPCADELRRLTDPYQNRALSHQELEGLRQSLNAYLAEQGYVNSGVVLDDQEVNDGVVTFTVVAGRLSDIVIKNSRFFSPSFVRDRISHDLAPPLNLHALQQNLQLLQQDPRIKKLNAELRPGLDRGEALLDVDIQEQSPYQAGLTVDNGKSPAIGDYHGELSLARHNLLGRGDVVAGACGLTDGGARDYALTITLPLNAHDSTVELHGSRSQTVLVEEPMAELDIRGESRLWRLAVNHPLWRRPDRELRLGLSFDLKENETFLLGRPFAFFDGTDNGRYTLHLWRFSQQYVRRQATQVLALSSAIGLGDDRTIDSDDGLGLDKHFWVWSGQGKFVSTPAILGRAAQLVVRSAVQLTPHDLLPSERFAMGGMASVRGYRENAVLRDNGLCGSLECRLPLGAGHGLTLSLAPFVDVASGWNSAQATRQWKDMASAGLGLLLSQGDWLDVKVFYGLPLTPRETAGSSLQDSGIHCQVRVALR